MGENDKTARELKQKAKNLSEKAYASTKREMLEKKKEGTFRKDWSSIEEPKKEEVVENIPKEKKTEIKAYTIAGENKEKLDKYSDYVTGTSAEKKARAMLINKRLSPAEKKALKKTGEWSEIQEKKEAAEESLSKEARYGGRFYGISISGEDRAKVTSYSGGERTQEKYVTLTDEAISRSFPGEIGKVIKEPGKTTFKAKDKAYTYTKHHTGERDIPGGQVTLEKEGGDFEVTGIGGKTPEEYKKKFDKFVQSERTGDYVEYKKPGTNNTFRDYSPEDPPDREGQFYSSYSDYIADTTDQARTHDEWENLQESWEIKTGQKDVPEVQDVDADSFKGEKKEAPELQGEVTLEEGQEYFKGDDRLYHVGDTKAGTYRVQKTDKGIDLEPTTETRSEWLGDPEQVEPGGKLTIDPGQEYFRTGGKIYKTEDIKPGTYTVKKSGEKLDLDPTKETIKSRMDVEELEPGETVKIKPGQKDKKYMLGGRVVTFSGADPGIYQVKKAGDIKIQRDPQGENAFETYGGTIMDTPQGSVGAEFPVGIKDTEDTEQDIDPSLKNQYTLVPKEPSGKEVVATVDVDPQAQKTDIEPKYGGKYLPEGTEKKLEEHLGYENKKELQGLLFTIPMSDKKVKSEALKKKIKEGSEGTLTAEEVEHYTTYEIPQHTLGPGRGGLGIPGAEQVIKAGSKAVKPIEEGAQDVIENVQEVSQVRRTQAAMKGRATGIKFGSMEMTEEKAVDVGAQGLKEASKTPGRVIGVGAGTIGYVENVADVTSELTTGESVIPDRKRVTEVNVWDKDVQSSVKEGFVGGQAAGFYATGRVGSYAISRGLASVVPAAKNVPVLGKAGQKIYSTAKAHPHITKGATVVGGTGIDVAEMGSIYATTGSFKKAASRGITIGAMEVGGYHGFQKGVDEPYPVRYAEYDDLGDRTHWKGIEYGGPGKGRPLVGYGMTAEDVEDLEPGGAWKLADDYPDVAEDLSGTQKRIYYESQKYGPAKRTYRTIKKGKKGITVGYPDYSDEVMQKYVDPGTASPGLETPYEPMSTGSAKTVLRQYDEVTDLGRRKMDANLGIGRKAHWKTVEQMDVEDWKGNFQRMLRKGHDIPQKQAKDLTEEVTERLKQERVTEIYGSTVAETQRTAPYTKYRDLGDLDIETKNKQELAEDLVDIGNQKKYPDVKLEIEGEGTVVNTYGDKSKHIFDVHEFGEDPSDYMNRLGYGFPQLDRRTVKGAESVQYITLGEQGTRKGIDSAISIHRDPTTGAISLGPRGHREKDVVDAIADWKDIYAKKGMDMKEVEEAADVWRKSGYDIPDFEEIPKKQSFKVSLGSGSSPSSPASSSYTPGGVSPVPASTVEGEGYKPSEVSSPQVSSPQVSSTSLSPSESPSFSPSASVSTSPSQSSSASPSQSPSLSPSASVSVSLSPSASPSESPSMSPSQSPSFSPSPSPSFSPSPSPSFSPSPSQSPSFSPSPSASPSPSPSPMQEPVPTGMFPPLPGTQEDKVRSKKPTDMEPKYKPSVWGLESGKTREEEPDEVSGVGVRLPVEQKSQSNPSQREPGILGIQAPSINSQGGKSKKKGKGMKMKEPSPSLEITL